MEIFKNPRIAMIIILLLVMISIGTIWKRDPNLGLDLKGGIRLTMQAVPSEDIPVITEKEMGALHSKIERRVNGMGIAESVVQKIGEKRLIVEIPGISDPEKAKEVIGQVGDLQFKKLDENMEWVSTGVSGKDLASADIQISQVGEYYISFKLNAKGAKKFGDLTKELVKKPEPYNHLAIFFDGELQSDPRVKSAITDGAGQIDGSFTKEEAKNIVDVLNAGALPVNVEFIEENAVGPLLGQSSIQQSLFAGVIGLALVLVFMVGYYRVQGLVADGALIVYSLITYAAYVLLGVTFTLAGVAGFILSVGMAVDANILIFERTKEELRLGRSIRKSIEVGFDRAFPSIFDSNMTTIITCAILWWLGTGAVKGFALTLAIGVIVSMFSAITVSRTFLLLTTDQIDNPSLFGVSPDEIATQA